MKSGRVLKRLLRLAQKLEINIEGAGSFPDLIYDEAAIIGQGGDIVLLFFIICRLYIEMKRLFVFLRKLPNHGLSRPSLQHILDKPIFHDNNQEERFSI